MTLKDYYQVSTICLFIGGMVGCLTSLLLKQNDAALVLLLISVTSLWLFHELDLIDD